MVEKLYPLERVNGQDLTPVDQAISTGLVHWAEVHDGSSSALRGMGAGASFIMIERLIMDQLPDHLKAINVVACINQATYFLADKTYQDGAAMEVFNEALLRLSAGPENPQDIRNELEPQRGYYDVCFQLAQLAVTGNLAERYE